MANDSGQAQRWSSASAPLTPLVTGEGKRRKKEVEGGKKEKTCPYWWEEGFCCGVFVVVVSFWLLCLVCTQ